MMCGKFKFKDKFKQLENKFKFQIDSLKERVSSLELENFNLKEKLAKLESFEKGANKRTGRLSSDVHQLKQKPEQPAGEEFGHRTKLDAEPLKVDSNHINNTENPVRKKASTSPVFNVSTEEDNSSQSSVEENNRNLPSSIIIYLSFLNCD